MKTSQIGCSFADAIMRLWPNGDEKIPGLRAGIIETAPSVFQKYGINTPLLVAHVMAQISHECGAGHDVVENLNYSAQRMMQVWPSRFPDYSSAEPFAGNPQKLANKVYGGRMGNDGINDGWNYRGRGASQTTGKEGYQKLAAKTGIDLMNNPDLINDPKYFMECGVADFIICGCLPYAKNDDLIGVTKKLNGGTIGLTERKEWLIKWKSAIGFVPIITAGDTKPKPADPKEPDNKPNIQDPATPSFATALTSIISFISNLLKGK